MTRAEDSQPSSVNSYQEYVKSSIQLNSDAKSLISAPRSQIFLRSGAARLRSPTKNGSNPPLQGLQTR